MNDKLIEAINTETGEIRLFDSVKEASENIGCEKSLIYKTLNANSNNYTAKGWSLVYIDKEKGC